MSDLFRPLAFARGPALKNRFMLAPLTNLQSHPDGRLSDDEYDWLTYRAEGGFGLVMTCASHVQSNGQCWPGQLGAFSDDLLPGLTRLAAGLKRWGAVSALQLHHGGAAASPDLIQGPPHGPNDDSETGAVALTTGEVEALVEAFVSAAVRAERAGFDGVEIHGAHKYVLCAFQSPELNRRTDRYGGSPENRARILFEIIAGVRARTAPHFQHGLRLSAERYGLRLGEQRELARRLLATGELDYLDLSLWDVFKEPNETEYVDRPLIDWFTDLPRGETRLGVAGKLSSAEQARRALDHGADFAILGRAAILHHDFPRRAAENPDFQTVPLPVTRAYLHGQRLGPAFVEYMNSWPNFVSKLEPATVTG